MRRRTIAGLVGGAAVAALIAGASIVWPGLDAQETPDVDTSVWALQTGDGRRYARVNTTIGELDTVRSISNPSQVVQTGDGAYLYSDSFSKVTPINAALPVDLDEDAIRQSPSTPAGTTDVATSGDYAAYLTDSGAVFAGHLSNGSATQLDPFPSDDEDAPQYTADAIAVDARGMLFAYSRADKSVLTYDIRRAEVRDRDVLDADDLATPRISAAGDDWVVVDADDGDVWTEGADAAVPAESPGAVVVGDPDPTGTAVYTASDTSLVRIPVDGSAPARVLGVGNTALGTPARPIVHDGVVYAAWLLPGAGGGLLWDSRTETQVTLDYGGAELSDQRRPVFVASQSAVILNETRTGWVWTVPDGRLVPSSQDWTLDDSTNANAERSEDEAPVVIDPRPPVAEPDAFGVRAGSLATLPVLMNDHDPNEDVLSIDPASVSGLDPGFGTVSITDDAQRLAVRVAPGARGSATFTYAVTDGTTEGGLASPPTSVTLTVAEPQVDTAPTWCGVEGCLVPWPEPEVARGGTVTVPVLPGWVDPEGDPLFLLSVENTSGTGSVAATSGGDVVYQHADDGDGGEQIVTLDVTVADTAGNATTKQLLVRVSPQPRLAVQSFALVDTIGAGLSVDVAPHVTGTTATMSLESVRVLDDAAATATVVGGTTSFDFAPQNPGTFRVGFTVTDGISDATGTARITILPADAPAQLATAPVVAFVHPQQDATLDVFEVVSNPTRRVLLLSDVVATADAGATLSVDAVGQSHLRVSGTTATGVAGRLGTVSYTISDGTDDSGSSVEGQATVYLLPLAPELAPIAVDDAVVVRAGSQIDIPVLDNDIAPSGGRPTLDPSTVTSSSPAALAFASGDVVRYLAPTKPGDYAIEYSIFTTGAPSLNDTATIRLKVLSDDVNRPPLPETLEGRVLSGQSTSIEFDGFGMDPDGDVVTLDRIVSQPESGSATISADGESIVYSSVPGYRGQASFRYRVVDASGETGEGTVRIGVLDEQSNPSPITFTDYVQVQVGADSTIRVNPLANDIDPTQGSLELTGVRPDLPPTLVDGSESPEYERLAEMIRSVGKTQVVISAGTEPTTMSFLYDVKSSSENTGRGLIVVKVVRERVPDYPIVDDTVLTAENREDFERGVDVLRDKASWSGGDVADLAVSLWGEQRGVSASGARLRGDLPATTRIIPFAITGEGPSGEVTTYAFLRVPGDDDLSLALRASAVAPEVDELASTAFDMKDLVASPRGSTLEVGTDLRVSGARPEAACVVESGTTVRYTAGAGAPWVDACLVPVRLAGQDDWTYLSVPIIVRALDPQPVLKPASLVVGPGETVTYDLADLTTWQLQREDWGGIRYAVDFAGSAFSVSLDGSTVTVTGADRAVPGSEEVAMVSVTSHVAVAPVRLILRVGAAPSTLPQGGSVTQQCSQAAGTSCVIPVVGAGGEVNPLPRTPLQVVDVRPTGACIGVTFEVASASSVVASWTSDAPGATCTATFTLQDAQSRRTAAERDGRILLDLQGYPKAPAAVVQTAYSSGSLSLRVDGGEARLAYPALTGFVIRSAGAVVAQCDADGACTPIAAPNGEQRTYEAWAVNSVGESRTSVKTVAWAYDSPAPPTGVAVHPVVTGGEGGYVSLQITGIDAAQTGSIEITSPTGERSRLSVGFGQTELSVPSYRVGSNSATLITVTPFSRFDLPPGLGGTPSGSATTVSGNGVGAPLDPHLTLASSSNGDGTVTISAEGAAALNGSGSTLRFGIVRDTGGRCDVSETGSTASFSGLRDGEDYGFLLCVESYFDGVSYGRTTTTASVFAEQSAAAPTGWTYRIAADPVTSGNRAEWRIRTNPTSGEQIPNNNHVEFNMDPLGITVFDRLPGLQVRYAHNWRDRATAWGNVTAAPGSAPYQLQATWGVASCVGGSTLTLTGSASQTSSGSATFAYSDSGIRFFDDRGRRLTYEAGSWIVPVGAVSVDRVGVTVSWAQGWGLNAANGSMGGTCNPNLPPPPPTEEPPPEPDPSPTSP
ncbi:Ig-like domain-containing protein [Microbacterium ulmi]|uniref:Ig-like domain-containing protein n=1 Tax=Microbacterium ulmi TaxID=179095 RepID=A0A7Y2Q2I6_9MICO|nr:Ig-like domain-containing protein [Microbacterium ulmi]NII70094.1 hypothetical protein [Microbacterium ulmi]NNH05095.1 Ig-like domain-containing protein [Microbacterium ulmi]